MKKWIYGLVGIIIILLFVIGYLLYTNISKNSYFEETLKCANAYQANFCDESCDNVGITYSPKKRTCIGYYTLYLPTHQKMVYEIEDLIGGLQSEYEYEYNTETCSYQSDFLENEGAQKKACYDMRLDEISWLKGEKIRVF